MLVWFEVHETMAAAIAREKALKGGSRAAKIRVIMAGNSEWVDLYDRIV
jgi:putative endonuclease